MTLKHSLEAAEHIARILESESDAEDLAIFQSIIQSAIDAAVAEATAELVGALNDLKAAVRDHVLPAMNRAGDALPEGHEARQWSIVDSLAFGAAIERVDAALVKHTRG